MNLKKLVISVLLVLLLLAFLTSCPDNPPPEPVETTETANFSLGSEYGQREIIEFEVTVEGTITARAEWTGAAPDLALILNGPTKVNAIERIDGDSPLSLTHEVTSEEIAAGKKWKITIACFYIDTTAQGTLSVTYLK